MDKSLKAHLLKTVREEIQGKPSTEAQAIIAGEIYMRQRHLAEAHQMEERLNDEIVELLRFDVNAELPKKGAKAT